MGSKAFTRWARPCSDLCLLPSHLLALGGYLDAGFVGGMGAVLRGVGQPGVPRVRVQGKSLGLCWTRAGQGGWLCFRPGGLGWAMTFPRGLITEGSLWAGLVWLAGGCAGATTGGQPPTWVARGSQAL